MYTTKVTAIDTPYSAADKTYFIDVKVDIFKVGEDGKETFHEKRSFGYPLGTTKEFITDDLKKLCQTLESDEAAGKKSAPLEEGLAAAEKLKQEMLTP